MTEMWQIRHSIFVISFVNSKLIKISMIVQNITISTKELISDKYIYLPVKSECSFSLFSFGVPVCNDGNTAACTTYKNITNEYSKSQELLIVSIKLA